MGQVQDSQNPAGGHARIGSQRQALRRHLAALGCAGLALFGVALAGAQETPVQSAPNVTVVGASFDKNQAWDDLVKQVAFGPRKPGTESHLKCRDWLLAELKKSCPDASLQPFQHTWSRTGKNIKMWNVMGSQNWEKAKKRVLLIAHWDTRPTADMETGSIKQAEPIPGANDGASGVAVVLELSRVLKDLSPDIGVQYLFVDGEDLGPGLDEMFLGAEAYAKAPTQPKADYGILLDMIGDKDLRVPKEPNSVRSAPQLIKDLYLHAARIGLASTFPNEMQDEIYDDHLSIQRAGIPTIDLIDFTYDPWHTLRDTPDKCSPESLYKVGILLETWLRKGG